MADTALWAIWWIWLSAALILAILEVFVPGFIFLGFALGAVVVSLLLLLPITIGLPALLAVFAVLSLIAWWGMRRVFGLRGGQVRVIHDDINK